MLVLDTSAVVAATDRKDAEHRSVKRALDANRGPCVIPMAILAEVAFMVESRVGGSSLNNFLADLEASATELDCGTEDIARIIDLSERYADLPLGFADAAVVACAERLDQPVLTCDAKHFEIVAKEGKLKIAK